MERKKESGEQRMDNVMKDKMVQKPMTEDRTVKESAAKEERIARETATEAPVYPVRELAACAKELFGSRQECVIAALLAAGKEEYTVSEARELVGKFLGRSVR